MKLIIVLFFLLLEQPIFSQEYSQYSKLINKAEIAAIHDSFPVALNYYHQAFSHYKNIFCKDYYNAAVCAEKQNNSILAADYLYEVYKKGYSIDSIKNKELFKQVVSSATFKNLIKDKRFVTTSAKYNIRLKNTLDSMLERDQVYRRLNPRNYMSDIYAGTIKQIDSANAYLLVSLIQQYGFPDEFSLGADSETMMRYGWEVLFIHQQHGSLTRVINFSDYILSALAAGKILSHLGVYLYSDAAGGDTLFGSGSFFKVVDSVGNYRYAYYTHFYPAPEARYNKKREAYNLESLDDYRQKMLYWLKDRNKDLIFDFYMGMNVIEIDKGMADYIKGLTYIE